MGTTLKSALLRRLGVLLAVSLLAAAPSLLVVQDRWLGSPSQARFLSSRAKRIPLLRELDDPGYFALVLACSVGITLLFASERHRDHVPWTSSVVRRRGRRVRVGPVQRAVSQVFLSAANAGFALVIYLGVSRRRLPSWELVFILLVLLAGVVLQEVPAAAIFRLARWRSRLVASILVLHLALIQLFASFFSGRRLLWLFASIGAVAALSLLRMRYRPTPIVWILLLAIPLYFTSIDAWWFAVIGDEYTFWDAAWNILAGENLRSVGSHLFGMQGGAYQTHPYFSSLLQAIGMKFAGVSNFGWRFSSLYLSILAVGFFWLFFRTFLRRRAALIASLFLVSSHYLMSFGKIGYNNLQSLFAMSLALAAAAWAVRTSRTMSFLVLGFALGFCFYVYPAALYAVPVPILLLAFYWAPWTRHARAGWTAMLAGLAVITFPLFLQPEYWRAKIAGTVLYNPTVTRTSSAVFSHFLKNLAYSAESPVFIPNESHFVAASYLDPVSGALCLLGLAYVLRWVRVEKFGVFILVSLGLLHVLVGASHDRPYPPTTRMFLLLPWFSLLSAIGLTWLLAQLRELRIPDPAVTAVGTLVVAIVVALNTYQAYFLSKQRVTGSQQLEALFLRVAKKAEAVAPVPPKSLVILTRPSSSIAGLRKLQDVYSLPPSPSQLVQVEVGDAAIPPSACPLIRHRNSFVIVKPEGEELEEWRASVEKSLRAAGKVPCAVRTTRGKTRFLLWQSPGAPNLCD